MTKGHSILFACVPHMSKKWRCYNLAQKICH